MRERCALLVVLGASALAGCGGSSHGGAGAAAAALTSARPAATSSGGAAGGGGSASPAPPPMPAIAQRITDPGLVAMAPGDGAWYFRRDDPGTSENEAARELARAIAALPNGLDEGLLYEHLTRGGGLAIFVGGNNHERDDPPRRQSGWIRSLAAHVQGDLGLPGIQVDYDGWASGGAVSGPLGGAVDLATYHASHQAGTLRAVGLVLKAISAGAGEVRLLGHSKGGDVVQEAAWLVRAEPRFTSALAMGIPIWSAARPEPDPAGQHRMGGIFCPGPLRGRDWAGKLVVFNRWSDRVSHGELFPPGSFPGPGHDYEQNLLDPALRQALADARFVHGAGWEDRAAGRRWDY